MDSTKNIKFNFDDAGSLKRVKQLYDEFLNSTVNKSINFGQNAPGTFGAQSVRYITQEIAELKKLTNERERAHQNRLKEFQQLRRQEEEAKEKLNSGEISSSVANERLHDIRRDRRDLLAGTGYRKESTYRFGEGESINNSRVFIDKMNQTLEDSNNLLRDILSSSKEDATKMIQAIEENDDSTPSERLAASRAQVALSQLDPKQSNRRTGGIVHDLLTADNLRNILSGARAIGTSTSAMEATRNTVQTGLSGINAIGDAFGPIGGAIARVFTTGADIMFQQSMHRFEQRSNLDRTILRTRAISGKDFNPQDMREFGYSYQQTADLVEGIIKASADGRLGSQNTRNALMLERGWGIDTNVSTQLLEVLRSANDTDKDLVNILGGMQKSEIFKDDRAFLSEFTAKNFIPLYRELQRNQTTVSSGSVMNAWNMFESIGGQFAARHNNSRDIMSSINDRLMNPQGDAAKALAYMALRRAMPGADLVEIWKEQEKGIGSSINFKAQLDMLDMYGGDRISKIANLKGLGLSTHAAEELYNAQQSGRIRTMSDGELNSLITPGQEASRNTTDYDKINANFANQIIEGMPWKSLFDGTISVIGAAMSGWTVNVSNGELVMKRNGIAIENATNSPTDIKLKAAFNAWWQK